VKGLESIQHEGPSTVGVDTLILSRRRIPEAFLRGCGVPEALIAYLPSLISGMEPIQFDSCFISYSTRDQDFAERLHSRLRDRGLRVWFAPEDVQGGKKLHEQIDEAIRYHDRLLLVLSPESMASESVRTEIRNARKAEIREGRRKLFPIRLVDFEAIRDWECFDADSGKDPGVEIREYFIPDFSDWKDHDAFEAASVRPGRGSKSGFSNSARMRTAVSAIGWISGSTKVILPRNCFVSTGSGSPRLELISPRSEVSLGWNTTFCPSLTR
jgi:hypothetical protein